jgi:hypothetical protein
MVKKVFLVVAVVFLPTEHIQSNMQSWADLSKLSLVIWSDYENPLPFESVAAGLYILTVYTN